MSVLAVHKPRLKAMDRRPRTLRELADELLEYQRVEYIDEDRLTIVTPPSFTHGKIIESILRAVFRAQAPGAVPEGWSVRAGDFQFERVDHEERFFVPDIAIAYPGTASNAEFQDNLAMVVEVTSPESRETVKNDYGIKFEQYAAAGVPLYLLVDQEKRKWSLFALSGDQPGYLVASEGGYGAPVELPEPFGFAIATDQWPTRGSED